MVRVEKSWDADPSLSARPPVVEIAKTIKATIVLIRSSEQIRIACLRAIANPIRILHRRAVALVRCLMLLRARVG